MKDEEKQDILLPILSIQRTTSVINATMEATAFGICGYSLIVFYFSPGLCTSLPFFSFHPSIGSP